MSKPDQQQKIEIGDQPGHAFAINQGKCKWTKPMEIAGTQTKEDIGTGFDEINGNKSHGHGYVVGTLASGIRCMFALRAAPNGSIMRTAFEG